MMALQAGEIRYPAAGAHGPGPAGAGAAMAGTARSGGPGGGTTGH